MGSGDGNKERHPLHHWGETREPDRGAPVKIRVTVRGLSPCREPLPPSRLKPSPAEVFSSVTVQTAASAAGEEGVGWGARPSGHAAHGTSGSTRGPALPPRRTENSLDSSELSLATEAEAEESVEERRSGLASSVGFLVTITACLGPRAWRRTASASLWVAPLRDLPLMERTSLPFWMVPSWEASPLGNTL